jgi:amino-acid N-acetyltransferase
MNYNIVPLIPQDQQQIIKILQKNHLPVEDIPLNQHIEFYGIKVKTKLLGIIGVEYYQDVALLRSLVIDPKHRKKGMARQLVSYLEIHSKNKGTLNIYLLTTTAKSFFESLSYYCLDRIFAPEEIKNTLEFSQLCADSATFMTKKL